MEALWKKARCDWEEAQAILEKQKKAREKAETKWDETIRKSDSIKKSLETLP